MELLRRVSNHFHTLGASLGPWALVLSAHPRIRVLVAPQRLYLQQDGEIVTAVRSRTL